MATTLADISIKDSSSWNTYLNLIYPVGSVYSSYTSTSPASRFGGSWTAITGTFPYYNAGTGTGGSNSHTLTVAEMPSHSHSASTNETGSHTHPRIGWNTINYGSSTRVVAVSGKDYAGETGAAGNHSHTVTVAATGGGAAHNNMPAYQTLYAWRRTA